MQKIIKIVLIALLIINVLYVFGGVLYHPLQSIDSIGIWFFKAKAFYIEHGFPNNVLHAARYSYSHQEYPVGLPFLIFLLYNAIGGVNEKVALLFYPLMYLIILILAYNTLRRSTTSILALTFTYFYSMFGTLIASGGRILAGGADIILALIEWFILFLLYKKKLTYKRTIAIVIVIMIASQIKLEGAFLSLLLLFFPLKPLYKVILFCISLLPLAGWLFMIHILKIPSDTHIIIPGFALLMERLAFIIIGIAKELVNINNWYIFWPLLFIVLFIKQDISQQVKQILIPAYGVIMAMFILVYLFASTETYSYITSSFDRILLQHSAIIFLLFFEKMNLVIQQQIKFFQPTKKKTKGKLKYIKYIF